MSDDDVMKLAQPLLSQMKPEDAEELKAIAADNADAISDGGADPMRMLGLRGFGMDDEAVAGALDLGAQLVRQGMLEQAFKYFMGMVQVEPLNWEVYRMLGLIQHRLKNYPAAAQLYVLTLAIKEDEPLTTLYLGECELHLGQTEYGLINVKRALEALRGSPENKAFAKRAEQILAAHAPVDGAPPPDNSKK